MGTIFSKKQRSYSEPGFTLLEVMVAMSIIAIALTSVFHVQFQTIIMNNNARFDINAPLLARSRMARIETSLEDIPEEEKGDFGENYPGYSWHHIIEDVESENLGEASNRLKKIEVIVSLNDDEYVYRINAYRMQ
jgi:general secretion pathway protein I